MKVIVAALLTLGPNPMAVAAKTHRLGDNRHLAKSAKSKSDKIAKGNPVPTYKSVTNICEGQRGVFLAAAGNPSITCEQAANGGGALATNALQTGGDVSCGASGTLSAGDLVPITTPFSEYPGDGTVNGPLCPANIHSHIGAEHRSSGQGEASYEDNFGPENGPEYTTVEKPVDPEFTGKRCNFYKNRKSNGLDFSNYNFKYCVDFKVGETYEFHWPHSSLAACGDSINQYQQPFEDGLLCNDPFDDNFESLVAALAGEPQLLSQNIGVQAQIVTVVNDEDYYFPHFIRGMIVNKERGYGQDVSAYLGSRTGGIFDATVEGLNCDPVSPVTWQVDRKCQLISASSLDEMCRAVMTNPGMRQCGDGPNEPCASFRNEDKFVVVDEGDADVGKICCYPSIRPGTSRGVVVPELQSDDVRDISGTCP